MQNKFADTGVAIQTDANGNISNYSALITAAEQQYNKVVQAVNNGTATEEDLDNAKNVYDEQIASLEQYEETLDAVNESAETVQKTIYEIQDLKFEELNMKMELQIEVNDAQMEKISYYLNKYTDDFYKMAESAVLMGQQMSVSKSNITIQKTYMEELDTAKANGEISEADYGAARDEVISAIRTELESMNELDKSMQDYYGNTLSMAQEEIDKYSSKMENLSGVLDHYSSMMSIIGKETDYATMGVIL
jgi:hypothetical protein